MVYLPRLIHEGSSYFMGDSPWLSQLSLKMNNLKERVQTSLGMFTTLVLEDTGYLTSQKVYIGHVSDGSPVERKPFGLVAVIANILNQFNKEHTDTPIQTGAPKDMEGAFFVHENDPKLRNGKKMTIFYRLAAENGKPAKHVEAIRGPALKVVGTWEYLFVGEKSVPSCPFTPFERQKGYQMRSGNTDKKASVEQTAKLKENILNHVKVSYSATLHEAIDSIYGDILEACKVYKDEFSLTTGYYNAFRKLLVKNRRETLIKAKTLPIVKVIHPKKGDPVPIYADLSIKVYREIEERLAILVPTTAIPAQIITN